MKKILLTAVSVFALQFSTTLQAQVPAGHAPGMLGVALDEVEATEASNLSLPGTYGAWVRAVGPGSPAAKAGVQANDVIVAYNGIRVESAMALSRMVHETPAGRKVEIRLIRAGSPVILQPVLGAGKVPAPAAPVAGRAPRSLGVWIEQVDPTVAGYLGLAEGVGMIVREIQPGSAAEKAGLTKKDILLEVSGIAITSAEAVSKAVNGTPGNEVHFKIIRSGQLVDLNVGF